MNRYDNLLEIVNQDDPLQIVIRSHLKIESVLINLIEEELFHSDQIDVARLSFPTKVDLAIAMALIPVDMKESLNKINSIRNRFAHNLDSKITNEDISYLYDHLDETGKESLLHVSYEEKSNAGKFGGIVLCRYYYLQRIKDYHRERRIDDESQV